MRRLILTAIVLAAMVAATSGRVAAERQGQRRPPPSDEPERARPRPSGEGDQQQARPRPPSEPERARPPRPAPPPHTVPPGYDAFSRRYAFPPVSVRLGFYYHPYFGFYYGPYYGPFYPYPGPYARSARYSTAAMRLRVKPVETEVYLNGYYAGIVDDFDGVFQRLYVPGRQSRSRAAPRRLRGLPPKGVCRARRYARRRTHDAGAARRRRGAASAVAGAASARMDGRRAAAARGRDGFAVRHPAPSRGAGRRAGIRGRRAVARDGRPDGALRARARRVAPPRGPARWYQTFQTELELTEGATTRLRITLVE